MEPNGNPRLSFGIDFILSDQKPPPPQEFHQKKDDNLDYPDLSRHTHPEFPNPTSENTKLITNEYKPRSPDYQSIKTSGTQYFEPLLKATKRSWTRAVFSNLQRKGLEKRFQVQKYITKADRRILAATLGLTDAQVKVWFQNRRMKWRQTSYGHACDSTSYDDYF